MLYHLLTYIFHYISLRSRAIRRLVFTHVLNGGLLGKHEISWDRVRICEDIIQWDNKWGQWINTGLAGLYCAGSDPLF